MCIRDRDGIDQKPAHARHGEHLLHDQRTAHDARDHRDDRIGDGNEGVSERVANRRLGPGQPLRSRQQEKFRIQGLDQFAAQIAADRRDGVERQRDDGENHRIQLEGEARRLLSLIHI